MNSDQNASERFVDADEAAKFLSSHGGECLI